MKVLHVVGARPNFMKVAPVMEALGRFGDIGQTLLHTGQHYDHNMSKIFLRQLGLPTPDICLGVGSGSHSVQTANIMLKFEQAVVQLGPDIVLVYGDVNSTTAAALVCAKLGIPVGHVEAGLRSRDRSMPEEINRIVTDSIANVLFTPSMDGNENLLAEGIDPSRIHFVGNVMIDTLVKFLPKARGDGDAIKGIPQDYALLTLHRPANVDDMAMFKTLMRSIVKISRSIHVVFPVHPRTRESLKKADIAERGERIHFLKPLDYLSFLALEKNASVVITDSGGVQEETTFLGVPCLTLRENTERPITITMGTNKLVGRNYDLLSSEVQRILDGGCGKGTIPPLWDGKAAERIAEIVSSIV